MKIGIDISQTAYKNTGVTNFLTSFVNNLLRIDKDNSYILFYSSFRRPLDISGLKIENNPRVKIKKFIFPPTILNLLWNKFHILPIEFFIGNIDLFITSDWTEPPAKKAKKATILYDLIVYKYPQETALKIVQTQKNKLKWVKKESDIIFCISKSTEKDVQDILGINSKRLRLIYPGL